jgi:hypothetical protein
VIRIIQKPKIYPVLNASIFLAHAKGENNISTNAPKYSGFKSLRLKNCSVSDLSPSMTKVSYAIVNKKFIMPRSTSITFFALLPNMWFTISGYEVFFVISPHLTSFVAEYVFKLVANINTIGLNNHPPFLNDFGVKRILIAQ